MKEETLRNIVLLVLCGFIAYFESFEMAAFALIGGAVYGYAAIGLMSVFDWVSEKIRK